MKSITAGRSLCGTSRLIKTAMATALCLMQTALANAGDAVKVGSLNNPGDISFFIADQLGYFAKEGLDVELVQFDSAGKMMAPLSTGQLDVAGGALSAGLFNLAARDVALKIVASRSKTAPGYLYNTIVVRKDLVDSGQVKSVKDLKGLKFAFAAPATAPLSQLNEALKSASLSISDIQPVYLSFPQQVAALQSKAIDAAILVEPYTGPALASGSAVVFAPTEQFYPSAETSLLFFGERFVKQRTDVPVRFLRAWLRGVRAYNDAVAGGNWKSGPAAERIIEIYAKATGVDKSRVAKMSMHFADPNGELNMASVRKDLEFFKSTGELADKAITVEKLVDLSYLKEAVQAVGRRP